MFPLTSSPSISNFILSHPPLTLLETKCTTMRDLKQVHTQVIKSHTLSQDPIAISRLLNFIITTSTPPSPYNLNYALLLFSHSPVNPTHFMWNSLIRALCKSSSPHLAISLFREMLNSPPTTQPQRLTYPSLFVAYARMGFAREGGQLHGLVLKLRLGSDPYVRNSIISMYATCGCVVEACRLFDELDGFDLVASNSMIMGLAKKGLTEESRRLFDEMPTKNSITWSSMISGYVRSKKNTEALRLFYRMQAEGIKPNEHTMVSLLSACAYLGALKQGEWIHSYIRKNKFEPNSIITTAIIDMYCKCGSLEKAKQVFEDVSVKGLSAWNAMILGLAMHGHGKEAMHVFSRLELSSLLKPDKVSFVSILTACNHSGFVAEARYYFDKMVQVNKIEPEIEHYGCLIDVLARKGLIKEAEELLETMMIEPDMIMLGSMLSACCNYGEVEILKRVKMRVLEVGGCDSGGYVMLSNGYKSVGEFSDGVSVREVMKEKGVRKEVGSSLIEVDGVVSEFVVEGMLHCESREICRVLDWLDLNMRKDAAVMEIALLDCLEIG